VGVRVGVRENLVRAADLIDRLKNEELVPLPTLTREELAITGSLEASPLRDGSEIGYWEGLGPEAKRAAGAAALRSLGARRLIDLTQPAVPDADGNVSIHPQPELGVILAARGKPSFVAVGSEPQRGLFAFVRLYGVIDERRRMNFVLLERTSPNGVHEFALCLPARAAEEVSNWACGPDADGHPNTLVRTIEIIRPSDAGPSRSRLAILVGDESNVLGEFDDKGEIVAHGPITHKDLSERLSSMLAIAGRLGNG
jgi:hypothetical protein